MRTKPIKVVIVPHGIQEHYSVGFVNAVADVGVKIDFVCSENIDPFLLSESIRWKDLGQNRRKDRSTLSKLFKFVLYHLRLIVYVLQRRDSIVHVIGTLRYEIVMGIVEGLIFRLFCRRYYLTVHNLIPHDSNRSAKESLYRWIYRLPHCLVVHTNRMRDELIRGFGVASDRIILMHHGLNEAVPVTTLSMTECRRVLGLPRDGLMLLFFGNIAPYKGLDVLLNALMDIPGVGLVIAGKASNEEYRKTVEELIRRHPRCDDIYPYIGWVENEKIPVYFGACDALVLPYRHIDQSGVLFLALRYGTPLIAFDVGAIREYVPDYAGIVVADTRRAGLVNGIRAFIDHKENYKKERIKSFASDFQWGRVILPVIEIYQEAFARP